MQKKPAWKRGSARYYCLGRVAGASTCAPISEAAIIDFGFSFLATAEAGQFQETEALRLTRISIDEANAKLADLDSKTERYLAAIEEGGEMRLVTQRLREIEQQQDSLREVVRQKRNELAAAPKGGSDFGSLFAEDVKAALNDKSAVKERHRISTALNRLLTKVVWSGDGWLMFHTRDGNMIARTVPRSALERAPRKDKKSAA